MDNLSAIDTIQTSIEQAMAITRCVMAAGAAEGQEWETGQHDREVALEASCRLMARAFDAAKQITTA
jgi:hypothetical protein